MQQLWGLNYDADEYTSGGVLNMHALQQQSANAYTLNINNNNNNKMDLASAVAAGVMRSQELALALFAVATGMIKGKILCFLVVLSRSSCFVVSITTLLLAGEAEKAASKLVSSATSSLAPLSLLDKSRDVFSFLQSLQCYGWKQTARSFLIGLEHGPMKHMS